MSQFASFALTVQSHDVDVLTSYFDSGLFKYIVGGKELAPTTGQPHLQCTVVYLKKRGLKAVQKELFPHHIEPCRNVHASITYCKKDNQYVEYGVCPIDRAASAAIARQSRIDKNKRLNDSSLSLQTLVDQGDLSLNQVPLIQKARLILASQLPPYQHDDVRGIWFVGPPGTGKSHTARDLFPLLYDKPQNKWFDNYAGEETILLDDLDTDVLGHHLKRWMDKWACSAETKFGKVNLRHKVFIVTSNYSPEELFKDAIMAQAIRRRCTEVRQFHNHAFNPAVLH